MLDKFVFNVYLPSTKEYTRVSELTNSEYINILKFNKNNDLKGMSDYMEWLIQSKMQTTVNLHRIDKFCILLTLMMVNISPTVTLTGKCETTDQEYDIRVDIVDVLNTITNVDYIIPVIDSNDIKITTKYPTSIMCESPTIHHIIDTISIAGVTYQTESMTDDQFNQVIGALPGRMFKSIVDTVRDMRDKHTDQVLLDVFSPYIDNPTHSKLTLDLLGNSLFEFICTLLGHDLNGFYELQFAMMNNYKFPPEYYMQITPTEVKTFYGYMRSDVEKKNKHIENMKTSRKSPIDNITG